MDLNKCHAMRYLLIQLLLQILLRPGEFSEAASELVICCKKTFGSSDLLGSSGEDESNENGAPELMDVLVDTMLSLLPQSSAPLRTAIEQVSVGKYFFSLNFLIDNKLQLHISSSLYLHHFKVSNIVVLFQVYYLKHKFRK